ncbi:hypothetical protein [Arthrobacter sp. CAN_A1]|uniref:hypothetical protein n=1 Tax=Arthrobacter sp. CAN_A1 TaxID=2787717 RepID=UPI0018C9B1E2
MSTDDLLFWTMIAGWITAVATFGLVVGAFFAWRTAHATLCQSKEDSARQTRPYVYAVLVNGIWGPGAWDLKVHNSGRSAARDLTVELQGWPEKDDLITDSLRQIFMDPQVLPPGINYRVVWRTTVESTNATGLLSAPVNGIPGRAVLTFRYRGEDPNEPEYADTYVLTPDLIAPITPMPTGGHEPPSGLNKGETQLHKMLQHVVRALGELRR